MSASSKKKLRKEQNIEVMTERQKKERSDAKKLKAMTVTFVVTLIAIVGIFLGSIGWNLITTNGLIEKATIALTVGDHKLNSVTMNYFFRNAVVTERESYGDYAQYFLTYDVTKPLNEQTKDAASGQSWADYYMDKAIDNARAVYTMYDKAVEAKFELPESYKTDISNTLLQEQFTAVLSYGVDYDVYLRQLYGNGANAKNYEEFLTIQATASAYYNQYKDQLYKSYTAEQIAAFESGKESNYDAYSFYYYTLNYSSFLKGGTKNEAGTTTYSDAEKDAARKAIEEAAAVLSAATNRDELEAAIAQVTATEPAATEPEATEPEATDGEVTEPEATEAETAEPEATEGEATEPEATEPEATEPEATEPEATEADATEPEATEAEEEVPTAELNSDLDHTNLPEDYAKWLGDAERKAGDIEVFPSTSTDADGKETVNGYYVLMYQARDDKNDLMANIRQILIVPEGGETKDGVTTYTDEEWATAKQKADDLLAKWNAGSADDASFAALVESNSKDYATATTGGLYENVHEDFTGLASEVLTWTLDDARKAADTAVIKSSNGYYVVYFVGDDDQTYRQYRIEQALIAADMTEWETSIVDAVEVVRGNESKINKDLILQPASN